jgi:hypothetical protein
MHRPSHLEISPADSVHVEGMGLCHSNLSFTASKRSEIDVLLQYDGKVTVDHSPTTATFDPANHSSSFHTHHLGRPKSFALSGIPGNLAHLSQILSSVASMAHAPTTPTQPCASTSASTLSPPQNTPS